MAKLNQKIKSVKPSATLVINELSAKLVAEGKEVYRLGFGQSPFPVPRLLVDELKVNAHRKEYLPVLGLYALRESVAGYFRRNYGLATNPENISIGPGSKELIYDYLLVSEIDELLLPTPSWVSYEPQGQLTNKKVVWLNSSAEEDWKLLPETIEAHCKDSPDQERTIIFNYPSNPIGNTYGSNELRALAKVFRKYNITVIADEIYGELHHDGMHDTLAKYYPEGTIISTGLSKWAGAGGWRLGVFVFPKELHYIQDAMAIAASETYTTASTPIQYSAVRAYEEHTELKDYIIKARKALKIVGKYCYNSLSEVSILLPQPSGGFYLFPNFFRYEKFYAEQMIKSNEDMCKSLLRETGVALLAGTHFGHPSQWTARLSYVDFDGEVIMDLTEKQIEEEVILSKCIKLKTAMERIQDWVYSKKVVQI